MKLQLANWMSTGALCLFLGLGTTAWIQAQDQREDAKPAQPENRPEATKPPQDEPAPNAREAQPSKQNNEDKPTRREDKPAKQNDTETQAAGNGQSAERASSTAHRRGGHIPDDKFRAHFGRQHTFKMQHPTVVEGQPTFQSGGYSFVLIDAWPSGWDYTDECYVDYVDEDYFLFDLAHPDVRLAIVAVL